MNTYVLWLAEVLVSLIVSLAVLRVLARPLVNVLNRICPDEQLAFFWLCYTKVMLLIAPLFLVLTVDLLFNRDGPILSLRLALVVALGGLLIGLRSIGKRLGQFVAVPDHSGSAS